MQPLTANLGNTAEECTAKKSYREEGARMMEHRTRKMDSLSIRSVLSYYEANIASSQDSASKSFLTNLACSPNKERRRLSMGTVPFTHQSDSFFPSCLRSEEEKPKRVCRRASWCADIDTSSFPQTPSGSSAEKLKAKSRISISQGKVRETKAIFEGASSPKNRVKPCMGRTSSTRIGVEALRRQDSFINAERFQVLQKFWSSLPNPCTKVTPPRYPSRWDSMQTIPETIRDIALKASAPACFCKDENLDSNHEGSCMSNASIGSYGLFEQDFEADDSSVQSSALCLYDGSTLYLTLPQGCMLFRSNHSNTLASSDQVSKAPSSHGSTISRGPPSTRSLASISSFASIASFSTVTAPRRVRFSEENEVCFFEVDDVCSVFSEDGLELAQDFASVFGGGDDHGPRHVRRQGSTGSNATHNPGEVAWEYVGFYDEVRLPQNFGSAFTDAQINSVPRLRCRGGSLEKTKPSFFEDVQIDRAPQVAPRRGSMDLECVLDHSEEGEEDLDFDHFISVSSPVKPRKGILRPAEQGRIPSSPRPPSFPTGSILCSPDQAPRAIRRRESIDNAINGENTVPDFPSLNSLDTCSGPSCDVSPRKATRRQSIDGNEIPSTPKLGDVIRKISSSIDMDTRTVSTTGTCSQPEYTQEYPIERDDSHEVSGSKPRPTRRASMSDFVPMNEFNIKKAMRDAGASITNIQRIGGQQGEWENGKMSRRASVSECLRPTKFRGLSFEEGSDDAKLMAQVCASVQVEPVLSRANEALDFQEESESTVAVSLATDSSYSLRSDTDTLLRNDDPVFLKCVSKKRANGLPRYSNHSNEKPYSRRNFLDDQGRLRPSVTRGYSFSDDDSIFDDCASMASRSHASPPSSQESPGPSIAHGHISDSYSSVPKYASILQWESQQQGNACKSPHAVSSGVFFD